MSFSNPWIKRAKTVIFDEIVEPKAGSILYCKLAGIPNPLGTPEHTGVYVGGGNIIELNGDGNIKAVSIKEFLNSSLSRIGLYAYIACNEDGEVLHDLKIAERALSKLGSKREYNLILDNCHQFTSGSITGDYENSDNFFWMVESTIKNHFSINKLEWRVCDENIKHYSIEVLMLQREINKKIENLLKLRSRGRKQVMEFKEAFEKIKSVELSDHWMNKLLDQNAIEGTTNIALLEEVSVLLDKVNLKLKILLDMFEVEIRMLKNIIEFKGTDYSKYSEEAKYVITSIVQMVKDIGRYYEVKSAVDILNYEEIIEAV